MPINQKCLKMIFYFYKVKSAKATIGYKDETQSYLQTITLKNYSFFQMKTRCSEITHTYSYNKASTKLNLNRVLSLNKGFLLGFCLSIGLLYYSFKDVF